jgi:diacylglycerol kinase (ATP)
MKPFVILNPYAARWKARERWSEAAATLKSAGLDFDWAETQGPGDGIRLAEEAVRKGYSPIIAAGGDGSIGEVVNGLYKAQPQNTLGPFGLLPLGTANDLNHNLGLPLDLGKCVQIIKEGKTRRIDLIKANEWVFVNNSAIGLEPVVTLYNIRMVRLKGVIRYLVAALRAIHAGPKWNAKLTWDDGKYEGPISLVSVGNCPLTGGLFRMAPAADPADGKLTFVYGYAPTRLKMLALLPRTINGSFVNDPLIHQHHATHLEIEVDPVTPFQADGELRAENLTKVVYEVLPARLEILTS